MHQRTKRQACTVLVVLSVLYATIACGEEIIIPSQSNLICENYPDGIILCRDRNTVRRVQECRRLADGRIICHPVR